MVRGDDNQPFLIALSLCLTSEARELRHPAPSYDSVPLLGSDTTAGKAHRLVADLG